MNLQKFYSVTDAGIFFSFLGSVLVCIPLWWHIEAWNMGCVLYIFWSGSQALIQGINMTIWRDNVIDWAPVWCDITSRWKIASAIGICCSSLCINRRLYKIASISTVSVTKADKRRMVLVDCVIGLGIPVICVALYWFYEGQRYDLIEGLGCLRDMPNTWLAVILWSSWPVVIGLISMVYGSLTIRAFLVRRRQFNELMSSSNMISYNRYFRLMGLALIEILGTVPIGVWGMTTYWRMPQYKWMGLHDMHFQFSRIPQWPVVTWWGTQQGSGYMLEIWVTIVCPFVFFAFFGLAEEARKHYHSAATSIVRRLGISTSFLQRSQNAGSGSGSSKPSGSGFGRITMPSFVRHKPATIGLSTTLQRDSISSFSDRLSSSISLGDVEGSEGKAAYPVSEHSAGSSTYFPSPLDAKVSPLSEKPVLEIAIEEVYEERVADLCAVMQPSPDSPDSDSDSAPATATNDVSHMV
ncbi:Pheromone B alpha 3 receptor [Sparassis crispa]|uniref:Pheromone B alpha 3 receptor n=1 Tax=Sparassis crispa TaxID=139825 RepID=A0A401GXV6_9APHY|nr:Pheromone B alpha 3 receptor [Sparassis crispa]GBE87056.1 Pheromone B alpha 3 receptor [Sparassis crispa]